MLRRLPPPPRGVPALSHFRALADVPRNLLFLDPLILPRNLHLRRRPPPETLLASRTPWAERHIRLGMQWVEFRGFEFAFIFQDVHIHTLRSHLRLFIVGGVPGLTLASLRLHAAPRARRVLVRHLNTGFLSFFVV